MRKFAAKVDAIQPECINLWRKYGKVVVNTSRQGDGAPDCFLLHKGCFLAVEFKQPKGELKPKQKELHAAIANRGGRVYVIRSLDEAAALIGAQ